MEGKEGSPRRERGTGIEKESHEVVFGAVKLADTYRPPPLTRIRMSRSAKRWRPMRFKGSVIFHARRAGLMLVMGDPLRRRTPFPRLQWATVVRK